MKISEIKWIPEELKPIAEERFNKEISFRADVERANRTPAWRKNVMTDLEREYNK